MAQYTHPIPPMATTTLLVLGTLAAAAYFLARRRPFITARVTLDPSGKAAVTLHPNESEPARLMRLALTYGAKVRWLLNNEPEQARQTFALVVHEALANWRSPAVADLLSDTDLGAISAEATAAGAPHTVPGGEDFLIRYFEARDGSAWVTNDIPRPGMSFNIAWHYVHLLQAIRSRISVQDREWTHTALSAWSMMVQKPEAADRSLGGLRRQTDLANAAVSQTLARRAAQH